MDPEDEKELMEAIGALTHEKTILLIARRLKTVWHADQILVVGCGTHRPAGHPWETDDPGGHLLRDGNRLCAGSCKKRKSAALLA